MAAGASTRDARSDLDRDLVGRDRRDGDSDADSTSSRSSWYKRRAKRRARGRTSLFDVKPADWAGGLGAAGGAAPSVSVLQSQQTKHARRAYVGNLPETTGEEDLRVLFNAIMKERCRSLSLPAGMQPVVSVYLQMERKFAFVEFATVELANTAMQLNGYPYEGHYLKIQRPTDYNVEAVPEEVRYKTEPIDMSGLSLVPGGGAVTGGGGGGGGAPVGIASGGSAPQLFVGGLPPEVDEAGLRKLFEPFGTIAAANVVTDPSTGSSKGYGFVTYSDAAVVQSAIATLNNMQIGPRTLTVKISDRDAAAMGLTGAGGGVGGMGGMGGMGGVGGVGGIAPPAVAATSVVALDNMVTAEDLKDPEEYKGLVEDVTEECAKYGTLKAVVIPKPGFPGSGRVFLHYNDLPAAVTAHAKLNGRAFDGRTIVASFFDEAKFQANQF